MGRRGDKNKDLPQPLKASAVNIQHWGRRINEVFRQGPSSTSSASSSTPPPERESSSSLPDIPEFIEYQHPPDESFMSSVPRPHPISRQRSSRGSRRSTRSSANEPSQRPTRRSLRRRPNSQSSEQENSHSVGSPEGLRLSRSSDSTLSDTSPSISFPRELASSSSHLQASLNDIHLPPGQRGHNHHGVPTSTHRLSQQGASSSSPRAQTSSSSSPDWSAQTGSRTRGHHPYIQRSISAQGLVSGLLSSNSTHSRWDISEMAYATGEYLPHLSAEPQYLPSPSLSPNPLTTSAQNFSSTNFSHASSSSLYPMTQYLQSNIGHSHNGSGRTSPHSSPPVPTMASYGSYPESLDPSAALQQSNPSDIHGQNFSHPTGTHYSTLQRSRSYEEQSPSFSEQNWAQLGVYGVQRSRHTFPGPSAMHYSYGYQTQNDASSSSSMSHSNPDEHQYMGSSSQRPPQF